MVDRSTGEAGLASPLEGISDADDMGTGERSEIVAFLKSAWWGSASLGVACGVWINVQCSMLSTVWSNRSLCG